MLPLATIQLLLVWLFAFPSDESVTRRKKIAYFVFASSVIVSLFLVITSSGMFIVKNFSINLEEAVFGFSVAISYSNMLYQSIVTILLRKKFTAIFKSLKKIHDESKKPKIDINSFH